MQKTIWLIRHAQSVSNAGGITETPSGIGLSELGSRQAESLARVFDQAPDLLVCSPYVRTALTAAPLRRRFPATPCQEWPVHEFTFLSPARYAGTTETDRIPHVQEYWLKSDPAHRDGEGAETFAEFFNRVDAMIAAMKSVENPFAAIISHGYVMKGVLWRLAHPGAAMTSQFMAGFLELHRSLRVPNTCVYPFQLDGNGAGLRAGEPWVAAEKAVGDSAD